ncbi:MAG TPA: DUF3160 domain-containing protein [Kofleriaceae bacterium]|nr:DUF3160 domain-containing protein [Kofleriaceae bacterium]
MLSTRAWLVLLAVGCGSRPVEHRPASPPPTPASTPTSAAAAATPAAATPAPLPACQPAQPTQAERDEEVRTRRFGRFGRLGLTGFEPKRAATSADVCDVADSNLARAEAAILARPKPAAGPAARPWDRKQPPARLSQIERRFGISAAERRQLQRDGFVVSARLAQPSWGWAFHEIYQSQLPIYVSADAILHAVYAAHDGLVARLEKDELLPRLRAMLAAMHCALPGLAPQLPGDAARDLDLYLAVARGLLADAEMGSALGDAAVAREARALIAKAKSAAGPEVRELFGRPRVIDFSQYQPRGHYTDDLEPYFRAAMWLSRLELNVVSRSSRSSAPGDAPDPRETPREAVDALALAELVAASGQGAELDRIEQVFALLAGRREDIPLPRLAELARAAGISDLRAPDAAGKLRGAVGDKYQRTARIHPMPQGSTVLPAIATLLGPRITADTAALRPLAHSEVPDRHQIHGGDVAYMLGHDRGRAHLRADLARYPGLPAALDEARAIVAKAPRGDDLYSAWLGAILALGKPAVGATPSFMATEAFADLRVSSAIAAYAQLRHNHVLIAGMAYGEGGCEIPDGYVEPAVAVYEAIAAYADLGARKVSLLAGGAPSARAGSGAPDARPDARPSSGQAAERAAEGGPATPRAYFERLGAIARVLAAISRIELANQPLPIEAQRWLSMVVEMLPAGSDGRPTYTGWYFDLFADRTDGIARPDLIADFFTAGDSTGYVGASEPRLGVFVVDTGGGPRAMIGPVARAYEHQRTGPRLTDEAAQKLSDRDRVEPWAARYTAPAPPVPAFQARLDWETVGDDGFQVMAIDALEPIRSLTIQLLDHHRVPVAQVTRPIPKGKSKVRLPKLREDQHVKIYGFIAGEFRATAEPCSCCDCSPMTFGAYPVTSPDESGESGEPQAP